MNICPFEPGTEVAAYLRESGGDRQEMSVAQQQAVAEAYCAEHELVLTRIYHDEAREGSNAEARDGLNALLADVRERYPAIHDLRRRREAAEHIRFGVLVWSLARLGRDVDEGTFIMADLRLRGVGVVSLNDAMLTGHSSLDRILEQLTFYKAQEDLKQISSEARRGLHYVIGLRGEDGRYLGVAPLRVPPVGFTTEQIVIGRRRNGSLHEVQRLIPDPATWERARLAWRLRIEERASYRTIQEATRLYDTQKNFHSCYSHFFSNRIYAGIFDYGDESYGDPPDDPFVEPLVPLAWYEQEAARREKRARRRRKGGKRQPGIEEARHSSGRLLSGLVYCARCGSALHASFVPAGIISTTGRRRKRYNYYQCGHAHRKDCDAGKVKAERLEAAVLGYLRETVLSPTSLRRLLAEMDHRTDQRRSLLESQLRAARKQRQEAQQQVNNLVDAVATGRSSGALLRRLDEQEVLTRELAHTIGSLEMQLDGIGEPVIDLTDAQLDAITSRALDRLSNSHDNIKKARQTLSAFIGRIDVEPGQTIQARIQFSVPHLYRWETSVPPRGADVNTCGMTFETEIEFARR